MVDGWVSEEFVPCPAMFVPDGEGFALTAAALELLDPPVASVAERLDALRAEAVALAAELPAATRGTVGGELLAVLGAVQDTTNALGSCGQAAVAELDRQGIWESMGFTSTAKLLASELRLRPGEAHRRVALARDAAARVGLDGQVLAPVLPRVAAAQAAGVISVDHASVICGVFARLPYGIAVDELDVVEASLVQLAGSADPSEVAVAGRQTVDLYDPDGPEPRDELQRRRRGITLSRRDDGAGSISGELTADLYVKLQTVLSPLAAPRPDDGNGPDTRTPAQRMHDALEDVCDRLLRSGTLPDSGGVPATVTVTMTLRELQQAVRDGAASRGRVDTDFGDVSVAQLLRLAAEAEIVPVVLNDAGGILTYGQSKRFATAAQTEALRARDHGCTFPGCDRPPEWCERHHVLAWLFGGATDIDNLTSCYANPPLRPSRLRALASFVTSCGRK